MKNKKEYVIDIVGITPIVYNRLKKELEDERKKLKKNELSEWEETRENWIRRAEIDNKGNCVLPREWIMAMLINSAKTTRLIPSFATSKKETFTRYIGSCMSQDTIFNNGNGGTVTQEKIKAYGRFVGSQGIKKAGKVWKVRPMIELPWTAKIRFIDPFGRMKKDELMELMEYGGHFIGFGDDRKQNFGRFQVEKITMVN